MKRNLYIHIALVFTLLSSLGCKKAINLEPENATYDQVFWVNGANVNKAVSGAYSLLRDALKADRSFFIFGDLAANNFSLGSDYWNYTSIISNGKFNFNYVPYLEGSVQDWSRFYKVINQCHLIIDNVKNIPDAKFSGGKAEKDRLEGEARYIRAYTYFYIQRVWGDVILTTESFKDPLNIPPLPRSEEAKTLAFCLTDLGKATSLLGYDEPKTHASKGGVLGLTANIHAWKHDYVKTQLYCDSIINSNKYHLEDVADYNDIWAGNSQESIFELNMLYNAISKNESSDGFFNVFLAAPFVKDREVKSTWFGGDTFDDIFYDSEDRMDKVIQPASDGSLLLTKYLNVNYYDPNDKTAYVVSNNLVLERLADIYLLRAEARFKNGNEPGCLTDLNFIRQRAGLIAYAGSGTDLFNELVDERRRELIGEGYNAFDLIRMGQLQRLYPDSYSPQRIAQKGYYWPLNMRVLGKQNALLTQNEWWKGHF
ncbi:MAG: RagB/SusD family nutrient uptake outer membrane protein [Pedobacter sp.]|nr:MAG: RagB/SusD family nutrient uptake outer membrane protein [Pedobacter sp.]